MGSQVPVGSLAPRVMGGHPSRRSTSLGSMSWTGGHGQPPTTKGTGRSRGLGTAVSCSHQSCAWFFLQLTSAVIPMGEGVPGRGASCALRPRRTGTTGPLSLCLLLLTTQCRFSEIKWFIDTLLSFELHYICFLFFFFLFFLPFLQKTVVVINSCTYSATYFGVKLRSLTH